MHIHSHLEMHIHSHLEMQINSHLEMHIHSHLAKHSHLEKYIHHRFRLFCSTTSFIGKTKKVIRAPADTAATGAITQYIGIWKIRKLN